MIHYLIGDATYPEVPGNKIIAHVCNNLGGWGRGFVVAISRRWQEPETEYRKLKPNGLLTLGNVQFVAVADDITVANMIAQKGYGKNNSSLHRSADPDDEIPLQYDSLHDCLMFVSARAALTKSSVHMPRIGCGLAGGEWSKVAAVIEVTMPEIDVYVYDLPE